eukprot:Blabericola_migrator_1__7877@NODE_402_length_8862_cov_53_826265_g319_i0_p3_GENE_NODE_402_length_8862_cov_53_826265_g319_i0NODE_402_length_8862_cov_53_826265_g319_i0_p3_ORF_typecomplete_len236_score33_45Acetyltransf_3/PF13302_7/1e19Acetyltransf_3/PF13302_7/6_3e03Acetyltransf_4/PF13420_7/5_6e10Acetyltransf_1/PF00583_25/3_9e06GNAT_acetyltran/PF12746_7/2_3e05Acetyltransf_8/PF13523_6/0_00011_NODE_402_length_8862_cov_53_826265_g319_i038944601
MKVNEFGQPVGDPLPDWSPRALPSAEVLDGRYCRLEKLSAERHGNDLFELIYGPRAEDRGIFTYCFGIDFMNARDELDDWVERMHKSQAAYYFAVVDKEDGRAKGTIALGCIDPQNGVVECDYVTFSPAMRRTRISTEAHYLLARYALADLKYRRYFWRCDTYNEASRRAALRLGFVFEGIFRQDVVYKGRTRDTAWYSMIDAEWPPKAARFEAWLDPSNFETASGKQIKKLEDC